MTITGSGFGATQGIGYVAFSDNGTNWGSPGTWPPSHRQLERHRDHVHRAHPERDERRMGGVARNPASVMVVNSSGGVSDSPVWRSRPLQPGRLLRQQRHLPDNDQACANLDGDGYSFSATALANAGLTPGATVTADGLSFTWPNVAACSNDNILAFGQTMLVNGTAGATTLGLLGISTNGGSQGTIVINYTDGTSSTATVSSNDWASSPGSGDTAVATMAYRNSISGGSQSITMYVFATTVPVDSSKTVASINFPDVSNTIGSGNTTAMHIFAVSLGS